MAVSIPVRAAWLAAVIEPIAQVLLRSNSELSMALFQIRRGELRAPGRGGSPCSALARALGALQPLWPKPRLSCSIRRKPWSGPFGLSKDVELSYASLSTGLDIVRKTLKQHEIATVQTTLIDESAGIVDKCGLRYSLFTLVGIAGVDRKRGCELGSW